MPEVRAAFRIAVSAFLLDPHRAWQDKVRRLRGDGRIGVRDDNEVFRIAVARVGLLVDVGGGL